MLLGSAIPFTLFVIQPTNKRLEDPSLDASSPTLLRRWGRLHEVWTVAGLASSALLLARRAR